MIEITEDDCRYFTDNAFMESLQMVKLSNIPGFIEWEIKLGIDKVDHLPTLYHKSVGIIYVHPSIYQQYLEERPLNEHWLSYLKGNRDA